MLPFVLVIFRLFPGICEDCRKLRATRLRHEAPVQHNVARWLQEIAPEIRRKQDSVFWFLDGFPYCESARSCAAPWPQNAGKTAALDASKSIPLSDRSQATGLMTAMSTLCQIATWQLDRDRSSYRPRSDIHRRTYQTSCAPGDDLVSRLRAVELSENSSMISRAPACAYAQGHVHPESPTGLVIARDQTFIGELTKRLARRETTWCRGCAPWN